MTEDHKREHIRFETDALMDYTGSEILLFHKIENLSLGGISIRTATPEALGTKAYITINFPDFNESVEVEGEVVWVNHDEPKDMGVKFIDLTESDKTILRKYIKARENRG